MKTFKRECKAAVANILTVMLVLSMLMSVFALSASADDNSEDLPKITNFPAMTFSELSDYYYYKNEDWCYNDITFDRIYDNLSTISVRMDDSESKYDMSDITNVKYTYKDSALDLEFTEDAMYTSVDKFGLLLVKADIHNKIPYILEGVYSTSIYSPFNENNYYTDYKGYLQYIESLRRCELEITICFGDEEKTLGVYVLEDIYSQGIAATIDSTMGTLLINLAHSKDIEDSDFYNLTSAIKYIQSVNDDVTNKYYVDVDSTDNIVIPLDDMSQNVDLVQTRIGDNVVYNSQGSVDFGDSAVPALSDGSNELGRVFYLPDGSYASDKDPSRLLDELYDGNIDNMKSSIRYFYLNDETVSLYDMIQNSDNPDSEYSKLFPQIVENGRIAKSCINGEDSGYTGLDGTEFTQKAVDAIVARNAGGNLNRFQITFEESTNNVSKQFISKLKEYQNDSEVSYEVRQYLKNNPLYFRIGYQNSTGYNSYSASNWSSMESYLNGSTTRFVLGMDFYAYDFNTGPYREKILADEYCYELLDLIVRTAKDTGMKIYGNESYMPLKDKTLEDLTLPFTEALEKLGVVIEYNRPQYNYLYNHDWDYYYYHKGALVEGVDYVLAKYGDFTLNTKTSKADINLDSYKVDENGNRIISFPVADIKDSVTKGVTYNVVNQIQYGRFNSLAYGSSSWKNNQSNWTWRNPLGYSSTYSGGSTEFYRGEVYYLNGDNIINSNTESVYYNYGYRWGENGLVRNTESKWGEMIFVSKPGKVSDVVYNPDDFSLTWTKPVDEGFGVTEDGKTKTDDYVKLEGYTITITDGEGSTIYSGTASASESDTVTFYLNENAIKGGSFTASIKANNIIGEGEPVEYEFDYAAPVVELTMTPDQPAYILSENVDFIETIENTGDTKLTNIVVEQSFAGGEYIPNDSFKADGTKASITELDVGESIELVYRVPANLAVDNSITNTATVTTAEKSTDTAKVTVVVYDPNLYVRTTADKTEYTDSDTVVFTSTITNTCKQTLTNITFTHDLGETAVFKNLDTSKVDATDSSDTVVIKSLAQGESIVLTYEIPAKDIPTENNAYASSKTTAKTANDDVDITAASLAEFRIIRPSVDIKITSDEAQYDFVEDVTYTVVVTNDGNIPLTNINVSSNLKGNFIENDAGEINSDGDFIIPELLEGKSVVLTFVVPSKNTSYGKLTNIFTVSAAEIEDSDETSEVEIVNLSLSIKKLVENNVRYIGDNVVFRSIVTNTGNCEIKNAMVTEDTNGTFELADGAVVLSDNTIAIASIMPGETYTYDYVVKATADKLTDSILSSTATVSLKGYVKGEDTNSIKIYNNSVKLTKTVNTDKSYVVGDVVVWVDTVTNDGDCDLTNVVITESLTGKFLTNLESTENSVTIPKLAIGETVEVEFTSQIKPADISNTVHTCVATVTANENLYKTTRASVTVTGPALTVAKYSDRPIYIDDERIVFTDVIVNVGDKPLTNVTVTEDLAGEYENVPEGLSANGNVLTISELAVGDSVVVQYVIDRNALTDTTVVSTVTVECSEKATDTASLTVTLKTTEDTDTETDTNDTESDEPATDTNSEDPATDTTSEEPATDTASDEPVTDTASDEPATDTASDEPATDTASDEPATDTASDEPATDTASDEPATDTASDEPATDTASDEPATDTASDEPATDTASDEPATDTASDEPVTDTDSASDTDEPSDSDSESDTDSEEPVEFMMGDVNMDGKVTAQDSLLIQRYAIGMTKLNDAQLFLADVNQDGKVKASDALNILRYTIKLATQSNTGVVVELPKELHQYVISEK